MPPLGGATPAPALAACPPPPTVRNSTAGKRGHFQGEIRGSESWIKRDGRSVVFKYFLVTESLLLLLH